MEFAYRFHRYHLDGVTKMPVYLRRSELTNFKVYAIVNEECAERHGETLIVTDGVLTLYYEGNPFKMADLINGGSEND